MSNTQVGQVYQQIISDVVEGSRVDFEEDGVDDSVLEELRQVSHPPSPKRLRCGLSSATSSPSPWSDDEAFLLRFVPAFQGRMCVLFWLSGRSLGVTWGPGLWTWPSSYNSVVGEPLYMALYPTVAVTGLAPPLVHFRPWLSFT